MESTNSTFGKNLEDNIVFILQNIKENNFQMNHSSKFKNHQWNSFIEQEYIHF